MKAVTCILALGLCILQSCVHAPEFTSNFDIVFGDEFTPDIKLLSKESSGRVLVVPVINKVEPTYASVLLQKFKDNITTYETVWPDNGKTFSQTPLRADVDHLAASSNCSSVLYIKVNHLSIYPPIRITVDIVMERLSDNLTILKGSADYDARNELVANSARRYFQLVLRRQNLPDKSLAILRTNPDFFEFAGWHAAKFINYIAVPPIKDLNKDIHDPKNIYDFEPTEIPDPPKPIKPVAPSADKSATPPVKGKLTNPKEIPDTTNATPSNTNTSYQNEEAKTPTKEGEKKFEEPPESLQQDSKPKISEDGLKEENKESTTGGRSLWLKNR